MFAIFSRFQVNRSHSDLNRLDMPFVLPSQLFVSRCHSYLRMVSGLFLSVDVSKNLIIFVVSRREPRRLPGGSIGWTSLHGRDSLANGKLIRSAQ